MEATQVKKVGLIAKEEPRNEHQLQLWVTPLSGAWQWAVRNACMPGGRMLRSCVLESGSHADLDECVRLGREEFERQKPSTAEPQAAA